MGYMWGIVLFLMMIVAVIAGGVSAIAQNAVVIFALLTVKNIVVDLFVSTIKGKHSIAEGIVFLIMDSIRSAVFLYYMAKFVGDCMSWGGLSLFLGILYSCFYIAISGSFFLTCDLGILEQVIDDGLLSDEKPTMANSLLATIFFCLLIFLNYHFAHWLVNVL